MTYPLVPADRTFGPRVPTPGGRSAGAPTAEAVSTGLWSRSDRASEAHVRHLQKRWGNDDRP